MQKRTVTAGVARSDWLGRLLSHLLVGVGAMLLLSAAIYAGYVVWEPQLASQDLYLAARDVIPLPVQDIAAESIALPSRTPVPWWTPTPGVAFSGESPARQGATVPALSATPPATGSAPSQPSPTPQPTATATPTPPAPVQIRIPALGVKRSIIELPLKQDPRTGTWSRDIGSLFRSAGRDLVGHWGGSAYPGQAGNMILVGHNYGYGYNGVFVRLARLKSGQIVYVVDRAGQTFTYRVKTVKRLKWRQKNEKELAQHLAYLKTSGPERLTLVSCGGANFEPFPERVYVVAEPVR